jgi:DNA-directed RNA polymerase specialized sigma24 family protein
VTFPQFKVAIWRGMKNNSGRDRHTWMPVPISGGWASRKALYATEDIEQLLASGFFRKKHKTDYICPRSRSKFKPYLAKSIHNIWSNWCRTRSRKYKEQYLAPLEDGTAWESLASDPFAATPETKAELNLIVEKLDKSGGGGRRDEIGQLLAQGRSLADIVQELSLPKSMLRLR